MAIGLRHCICLNCG